MSHASDVRDMLDEMDIGHRKLDVTEFPALKKRFPKMDDRWFGLVIEDCLDEQVTEILLIFNHEGLIEGTTVIEDGEIG